MTDHQPDVSVKCSVSRNVPRTAACRDCGAALDVRPQGRTPERCFDLQGAASKRSGARGRWQSAAPARGCLAWLSHGSERNFVCDCLSCTRFYAANVLEAFNAAATGDDTHLLTALGYRKVRNRNEFGDLVDMWWREL